MSVARKVATVGSATLISRLLGFLRDAGIAALLGAGTLSDAFFAAAQIPNLFRRLLAEGALNSAFIPIWLRLQKNASADDARRFGAEIFGLILLALGAFAILCALFAPQVITLLAPGFGATSARHDLAALFLRLSVAYVAIAGLVAAAAAILNAQGRVAAASYGLLLFNAVLIAAVVLVFVFHWAETPRAGEILSFAFVVAGLAQLAIMALALRHLPGAPHRPRFAISPETRRFFRRLGPGVIAAGIPQLSLIAGAIIASPSPAAVSWLHYANRLYELPLGVVSVVIASVMAPFIAAGVQSANGADKAIAQSRAFEIAIVLALPAACALALLAQPIAGGLFEHGAFGARDTAAVAAALAAICLGLPGHVLEKVLAAISFAHEDTRTPMLTALFGLAAAVIAALLLFPAFGHVGVAAAIALGGWSSAGILGVTLFARGWLQLDPLARRRLPRIVFATVAMGVALMIARDRLTPVTGTSSLGRLALLAILVPLGLALYGLALQLLRVGHVRDILAILRKSA